MTIAQLKEKGHCASEHVNGQQRLVQLFTVPVYHLGKSETNQVRIKGVSILSMGTIYWFGGTKGQKWQ